MATSTLARGSSADRRRRDIRRSLDGVPGGEFRGDVEGLRAIAVVAVVLFHAKVAGFEGGFVGVDVFFVVSGFLITQLLLRELEATGTISLHDFWARRARRLLPASCLVLVVTLVAARLMLAPALLRDVGRDAVAAGAFVVNFVFADRLGDYFNAQLGELTPSPLLHYWSLAVEEQFYLCWPLLLVLIARFAPRPGNFRRTTMLVVVVVSGASLLASIWMTANQPTWAFYLLPARALELLAGAAVAVVGNSWRDVDPRLRAATGWVGVVGVGYTLLAYDESIAFPGTATILPVLSTVLVLCAGGFGQNSLSPERMLALTPLQWIGRHSYSLYLWHWPALVLAEAKWGPLTMTQRFVAIAVSVVLSIASKALVEDPVRRSSTLIEYPGRSVVLGLALSATAVLVGTALIVFRPALDSGEVAAAPSLELSSVAAGAVPALDDGAPGGAGAEIVTGDDSAENRSAENRSAENRSAEDGPSEVVPTRAQLLATLIAANREVLEDALTTRNVPSNLQPSVARIYDDRPAVYSDGCVNIGVDDALRDCRYGAVGSAKHIVLYGDSHAAQWAPALDEIARDAGYELVVFAKGGCPTAAVSIPTNTLARTCPVWRDRVVEFISGMQPEMVVATTWSDYPNDDDEWAAGMDATIARIAPNTTHLVMLVDTPGAAANPQVCLSSNPTNLQRCTNSRERAVAVERSAVEVAVAERYGVVLVDPADWFCTVDRCPMVLGDLLIFRDADHITTFGAQWFEPLLAASVRPLLDPTWLETQRLPADRIVEPAP